MGSEQTPAASDPEQGFVLKVCGITSVEDALLSIELGATALGFNFYPPSPRYLSPERAAEVLDQLPPGVPAVAVMVVRDRQGRPVSNNEWTGRRLHPRIERLQLHGLESVEEVPRDYPVWIACEPEKYEIFRAFPVVIDSSWGRGRPVDLERLERLDGGYILSGGLGPDNVAEAIRRTRPLGVDVCSGVESEPGRKDPLELRKFLSRAREAREMI